MTEIIVALITGGLALIGVVSSNMLAARKTDQNIRVAQAITDTKIEELTREVREHNGFAQRVPILEQEMKDVKEAVTTLANFHMTKSGD